MPVVGEEPPMNSSAKERFIAKLRSFGRIERVPGIQAGVYTTNGVWLHVHHSALTEQGKYWFFVDKRSVEEWRKRNRVIYCFVCGDENTVVFIPDDRLVQWYAGANLDQRGRWHVNIVPKEDKLILHVAADRKYDVTEYVNRYDFISESAPLPVVAPPTPREERPAAPLQQDVDVNEAIMSSTELAGASLHDRVADMLLQVGRWMRYSAEKDYRVTPDYPYQIDVVWLDRGLIEVAVEVQVGGNVTEAKDRLIHAKRFGARKIIVVSAHESVNRLKSLCRYEPDLRNWLEIWSIPKVYQMYLNGRQFFELFDPFERQQWSEEIREFM
jgi:hypothetical protein